jgi:hypothetical protein
MKTGKMKIVIKNMLSHIERAQTQIFLHLCKMQLCSNDPLWRFVHYLSVFTRNSSIHTLPS